MFKEIKKNFGFGVMRLPLSEDKKIDLDEFSKMVDYFISSGFNYFDTAHGYLSEQSEIAIRECLSKRYKREDYVLTNKLSPNLITDYTGMVISLIGLIIPVAVLLDLLADKNRKAHPKDKKTDWFYKNEAYDRKFDERADKNNYRTL